MDLPDDLVREVLEELRDLFHSLNELAADLRELIDDEFKRRDKGVAKGGG